MRLPDFEAWAIFAKVVEIGSFGGAAGDLGVSTGTVSKAVRRLEERIGARLFHRTSRKLALTETGLTAREDAAAILAVAEAAEARATSASSELRGVVRVSAPMTFGVLHVASLLPEFLEIHPAVVIHLHLSDDIVDLVGGGFDIGLRIATLPDSSLKVRRLCDVGRSLVAAPSYLDRRGKPNHPEDLPAHSCLEYVYLPSSERWRFTNGEGVESTVTPTGPLRVNNAEALVPALLSGLGIALQPDFITWEDVAAGRLERLMPDWSAPPIALHLLQPPGEQRPSRVNALAAFLAQRLTSAPWARRMIQWL